MYIVLMKVQRCMLSCSPGQLERASLGALFSHGAVTASLIFAALTVLHCITDEVRRQAHCTSSLRRG